MGGGAQTHLYPPTFESGGGLVPPPPHPAPPSPTPLTLISDFYLNELALKLKGDAQKEQKHQCWSQKRWCNKPIKLLQFKSNLYTKYLDALKTRRINWSRPYVEFGYMMCPWGLPCPPCCPVPLVHQKWRSPSSSSEIRKETSTPTTILNLINSQHEPHAHFGH